jgi:hypothetical protein
MSESLEGKGGWFSFWFNVTVNFVPKRTGRRKKPLRFVAKAKNTNAALASDQVKAKIIQRLCEHNKAMKNRITISIRGTGHDFAEDPTDTPLGGFNVELEQI